MTKPTTIKEAIARWEADAVLSQGVPAAEAKEVKLIAQQPPIEKMDTALSVLQSCEKLSLSTNNIEKISGLNSLKNLRILSLGRNNIKSFAGLEPVSETLEELWISYNAIEKMKGINVLKNLKVLYMSNNMVKDWGEFSKLIEVSTLEDLLFIGNPLEEKHSADNSWRDEVLKRLPRLKKLDGIVVTEVMKSDDVEPGQEE